MDRDLDELMRPLDQPVDQYYVRSTSSQGEQAYRALKDGEMFLITDQHGDIRPLGAGDHGLYYLGTRFLSRYALTIEARPPLVLSSTVTRDNNWLMVDMTNPDIEMPDGTLVHKGTVHINRWAFLQHGQWYERIQITNFGMRPVDLTLAITFDADYVDLFEVRGVERKRRGVRGTPVVDSDRVVLSYHGLDEIMRETRLEFSPQPDHLTARRAAFGVHLGPRDEAQYDVTATCRAEEPEEEPLAFEAALAAQGRKLEERLRDVCVVTTSNEQFNGWLDRSRSDITMMLTDLPDGLYPFAGIPWYSTPFGRDGIITALEMLWLDSRIARGVLAFLAKHQATTFDPVNDAEPGKIVHEMRKGEMANLGEIPFKKYYGTVDATPLFVLLAGRYLRTTGDVEFIDSLWPTVERALEWIDSHGDLDGDGFVEYSRRTASGLANQGWKDSDDSVFHADGTLARGPIALVEVQGYVYEAKMQACRMASVLGKARRSGQLRREAETLREEFLAKFWCPELGTYVLALDGEKRPCRVKTSNAGHALFSRIASPEHAGALARTLMDSSSFADWGVRTVASAQARYNPMSYHNGSIWPHDNAMIAQGLARYGYREEALKILGGLFQASLYLDLHRLPELFCGFRRRPGEGPTSYPVSCNPQAWASGGTFMLLQSCLGLYVDALDKTVYCDQPLLPEFLDTVKIENMKVGANSVSLVFERRGKEVTIYLTERKGEVRVMVTK